MKTVYIVLTILFYASIPVISNVPKIVFLARGHDWDLVSEKKYVMDSDERNQRYYAAYKKELPIIVFVSRFIVAMWFSVFVFSLVLLKNGVHFPFRLEAVNAGVSFLLILAVVVPIIIFGRGWPPRPF